MGCELLVPVPLHCQGGEWAVGFSDTHQAGLLGVPAENDSLNTSAPSSVFPVQLH